jgi:flagellar biosynthesis protein FlhB
VSDKSQKTEKPTPKKKREAHEKGQIAKTPELAAWAGVLLTGQIISSTIRVGGEQLTGLWQRVAGVIERPDSGRAMAVLGDGMMAAITTLLPLVLGLMVLGVVLNLAQVGIKPSGKRLKPSFKKLNVFKGIKNMFSVKTAWETAKTFLKFGVLLAVGWPVLTSTSHSLLNQSGSLSQLLKITRSRSCATPPPRAS